MQVFNTDFTLTVGTYYSGTRGFGVINQYGSTYGSLSTYYPQVKGNNIFGLYYYNSQIILELDKGYNGNSGFYQITVNGTTFRRDQAATFISNQYISRWAWSYTSQGATYIFPTGATVDINIKSVRELIGEVEFVPGAISNTNRVGFSRASFSSPSSAHQTSGRMVKLYSGYSTTDAYKIYQLTQDTNTRNVVLLMNGAALPNCGWEVMTINGRVLRRKDATYLSSGGSIGPYSQWTWSDMKYEFIASSAVTAGNNILVNFFTMDEEKLDMQDSKIVRHMGTYVPQTYAYASESRRGFIDEGSISSGVVSRGTAIHGAANLRYEEPEGEVIKEISWTEKKQHVRLRYEARGTVGIRSVTGADRIDYIRINDTILHTCDALLESDGTNPPGLGVNSSVGTVSYLWTDIDTDPWDSTYISDQDRPEVELGKYDDTVYIHHFGARDSLASTTSKEITVSSTYREDIVVFTADDTSTNTVTYSGGEQGERTIELSGNRGVRINIENASHVVSASSLVPGNEYYIKSLGNTDWDAIVANSSHPSSIFDTGDRIVILTGATGSGSGTCYEAYEKSIIAGGKRLNLKVNIDAKAQGFRRKYITRTYLLQNNGGASNGGYNVVQEPMQYPHPEGRFIQWRAHLYADTDVPAAVRKAISTNDFDTNNLPDISTSINFTKNVIYDEGQVIDNFGNHLWENGSHILEVVPDVPDVAPAKISWKAKYVVGGVNYFWTLKLEMPYAEIGRGDFGLAVKADSGATRVSPADRLPRIHSTYSGTVAGTYNSVDLTTGNLYNTGDWMAVQIHPTSKYGAQVINDNIKIYQDSSGNAQTGTYAAFGDTNDYAVILIRG